MFLVESLRVSRGFRIRTVAVSLRGVWHTVCRDLNLKTRFAEGIADMLSGAPRWESNGVFGMRRDDRNL